MNKFYVLLFTVICLALGCSDSTLLTDSLLNSSIDGKSITISPYQKISLELDLHADGGYQWFCNIADTTVVRLDSINIKSKSTGQMVGGMALETLHFKALKQGQSQINLEEKRGWEEDIPPINKIQFTVLVK